MDFLLALQNGIPLYPLQTLLCPREESISHAPNRVHNLTPKQQVQAVQNALRYFPQEFHSTLAPEFSKELTDYGHIYMYRFIPTFPLKAYSINKYPTKILEAAAIIHMIFNNLNPEVAQYPHELVTYGGNGQVFSNWAQFWLTMKYLCMMENDQTLILNSGHPSGLFPSNTSSPRMVISNGMVIPNYSTREDYDRMFALGVTMYGQMTAGSFCYIGPQGIVQGTTLTLVNAGRKYLNLNSLSGKVFVSAGLGGMSGAQAKAAIICGCIGVVAEVRLEVLQKRFTQQWVNEIVTDLDELMSRIRHAKRNKVATSIGFHGNVVTLWERFVSEVESTGECLVDLGSDQTSCHIPFTGGYYPVQLSVDAAQNMISKDPVYFRDLVQKSLCRQVRAINKLSERGMKFWDYGNAFLLEASRAGADVRGKDGDSEFRYPSYMQDIMGEIFAMGFGPFRWICTSGLTSDICTTDEIALEIYRDILKKQLPDKVKQQYEDNIHWIKQAARQNLVVGSQARILYSDQYGRVSIATAFNDAIKDGRIKGPVVISRDHHDVSATDSPYRETSNIADGSSFTADMAVQNCIGDSFRGATWVALHNGGGVGWGEAINGGFGLVLDGQESTNEKIRLLLNWDVTNGLSRRSWAGDNTAQETIRKAMKIEPRLRITMPVTTEPATQKSLLTLSTNLEV